MYVLSLATSSRRSSADSAITVGGIVLEGHGWWSVVTPRIFAYFTTNT